METCIIMMKMPTKTITLVLNLQKFEGSTDSNYVHPPPYVTLSLIQHEIFVEILYKILTTVQYDCG
jgi:hypothetical protein